MSNAGNTPTGEDKNTARQTPTPTDSRTTQGAQKVDNPRNQPPVPPTPQNPFDAERAEKAEHDGAASGAANGQQQESKPDPLDPANWGPFPRGDSTDPNNPYAPNRRPDADRGITTGNKIAWIALGFLLGVFGLLIIFFVSMNRDVYMRFQAIKFTIVGVILGFIAEMIMFTWLGGDMSMLLSWSGAPMGGTTGSSTGSAF